MASHESSARTLAYKGDLVCQVIATFMDSSNIVALRREAMKVFSMMIKDRKAAESIADRNILPILAKLVCRENEDDQLKRVALKVLMALTPML